MRNKVTNVFYILSGINTIITAFILIFFDLQSIYMIWIFSIEFVIKYERNCNNKILLLLKNNGF